MQQRLRIFNTEKTVRHRNLLDKPYPAEPYEIFLFNPFGITI
jgi:hypothetical protein